MTSQLLACLVFNPAAPSHHHSPTIIGYTNYINWHSATNLTIVFNIVTTSTTRWYTEVLIRCHLMVVLSRFNPSSKKHVKSKENSAYCQCRINTIAHFSNMQKQHWEVLTCRQVCTLGVITNKRGKTVLAQNFGGGVWTQLQDQESPQQHSRVSSLFTVQEQNNSSRD